MAEVETTQSSPNPVTALLQAVRDKLPAQNANRTYEDIEQDVEELVEERLSRLRSDASTSGREASSLLLNLKPKTTKLGILLEQQARRIKAQRISACCFMDGDLQLVWDLLQQHATYEPEPCINYDGFTQVCARVKATLTPEMALYFKPSVFLRLERDHRGMVPVQLLMHYFSARSGQLHLRLRMAQFTDPKDSFFTEQQLREFIRSLLPGIHCLADLPADQVDSYCQIAARKFMVFDARQGKVRLRDLLMSAVWQELQELKMIAADDPAIGNNWFSQQSVARVLSTFQAWDKDQSGGLSLQEFCAINSGGTMSLLVLQRVFEEHVSKAREPGALLADEMSLLEFVDFVLAWDCRHSLAVIPYFFTIFDLQKQGLITPADLYTFFKEIHLLWRARGELDIPIQDVLDEIMDMARPASQRGITMKDLQACRMSGTVFSILSDVMQFYDYNNRENNMHASDDQ